MLLLYSIIRARTNRQTALQEILITNYHQILSLTCNRNIKQSGQFFPGDKHEKAAVNGEKDGLENGDEEEEEHVFYDKSKSFFDNISCESIDRAKG